MKAISIRNPWAFAVVHGFKRVENRKWRTRYRGDIAIHVPLSSIQSTRDDVDTVLQRVFDQSAERGDPMAAGEVEKWYREETRGATGLIVGFARLVAVAAAEDLDPQIKRPWKDDPWWSGPWGFVLEDARPATGVERCHIRGQRGIFEVPL